jgi:hypothetical protein
MSKAAEDMNKLVREVTEKDKELIKLFIKECCSKHNQTYIFTQTSLDYFIKCHTLEK